MSEKLVVEFSTKTILDLRNLQGQNHLNLEPGFQRKSVWGKNDRKKLVQSVLEGLPLPSIFLYRREDDQGHLVYDVLDGKQRLETIFMFMRTRPFGRQGFGVPFQFPNEDEPYWYDWAALDREMRTSPFLAYKLQVAEVSGPFADIVQLFVRINSTGKPLTSSEKRHAKFYTSTFLRAAEQLARRNRQFLLDQRIISAVGVDRMKDVELVSELLASILANGPIHKKQAVDRAVGNTAVNRRSLNAVVADFWATLRAVKRMFPDLSATRFRNVSEFYSLFLVVWELTQQKLVLNDRRRNGTAMELLRRFSDGVDEVRELQRKAKGATPRQQTYANYLLLVQQSTDALGPRQRRAAMLRELFSGLFEAKDEKRVFSEEQRRLLWNSSEEKECSYCGEVLTWANFQADHVLAHSRGGKTVLSNAALSCVDCNRSKGAGRRERKRQLQGA
jgi:5-methylcytosine-specific restriction endonuclease McrA